MNGQTVVIPRGDSYAEVIHYQDVRPLPGHLDDIPVFNSNSPEVIQQQGILLSTFPKEDMAVPDAHLNYVFNGRFDIFAHHIARGTTPDDRRTLFLGVLLHNPGDEPVNVRILQGVTYLSQEAPFRDLPEVRLSSNGSVYAGPGSRTTTEMLSGVSQDQWPDEITIPPGHVYLLMNLPIPLRQLTVPVDGTYPQGDVIPMPPVPAPALTAAAAQVDVATADSEDGGKPSPPPPILNRPLPSNGRTAMMYLSSDGPVHVASLATYAPKTPTGNERVPTLRDWIKLLKQGGFAGPRDIPPTDPETYRFGRYYYGRVAGVAKGSRWLATLTDNSDGDVLTIPAPGNAFSYVISSVDRNTLGTGQVQSAPMVVRYPDTAYRAHGNYGIEYSLKLPFFNNTGSEQTIAIKFQTPLSDENLHNGLRFRRPPEDRIFFRGTIRLRFTNQLGIERTHYLHLVQRRGEEGTTLLQLSIPAEARKDLSIDFIYPPDATPPHVLTIQNISQSEVFEARDGDASLDPDHDVPKSTSPEPIPSPADETGTGDDPELSREP